LLVELVGKHYLYGGLKTDRLQPIACMEARRCINGEGRKLLSRDAGRGGRIKTYIENRQGTKTPAASRSTPASREPALGSSKVQSGSAAPERLLSRLRCSRVQQAALKRSNPGQFRFKQDRVYF
jgi:hypothetical protein